MIKICRGSRHFINDRNTSADPNSFLIGEYSHIVCLYIIAVQISRGPVQGALIFRGVQTGFYGFPGTGLGMLSKLGEGQGGLLRCRRGGRWRHKRFIQPTPQIPVAE